MILLENTLVVSFSFLEKAAGNLGKVGVRRTYFAYSSLSCSRSGTGEKEGVINIPPALIIWMFTFFLIMSTEIFA